MITERLDIDTIHHFAKVGLGRTLASGWQRGACVR